MKSTKNLEDMLLEMASEGRLDHFAKGRAVLLAYWPDIKAMLGKGWSLKDIHRALFQYGCIEMRYESFRRLVNGQMAKDTARGGDLTPEKNGSAGANEASEQSKKNDTKTSIRTSTDNEELQRTVTVNTLQKLPKFGESRLKDSEVIF